MILRLKKENFAPCENNIVEYGINLTIKKMIWLRTSLWWKMFKN